MSIKTYIEEAIKKIEAERDREVQTIKERVTREVILPYNAEIDKAREKAVAEEQAKLSKNISSLQENFAKQKTQLIEAGEKKKADNANRVISTETSIVCAKYDKVIWKLKEQIENINE